MDSDVFTADHKDIINRHSIAKGIDYILESPSTDFSDHSETDISFEEYISSPESSKGKQLKLAAFHF